MDPFTMRILPLAKGLRASSFFVRPEALEILLLTVCSRLFLAAELSTPNSLARSVTWGSPSQV